MSLYDDVLRQLRNHTREDEMNSLRQQVHALQRVVAKLTEIVATAEGIDVDRVRKSIMKELSSPIEPDVGDEKTVAHSAYRGAVPDDQARCSICSAKLEEGDPEMMGNDGRRVCMRCFRTSP